MSAKNYQNDLCTLTRNLQAFSLVNADGQLLFSKETSSDSLTTTRLVAFQIFKKYLAPKPLDLFILNDPENGGFGLQKIIFITALNENLFLIWNKDNSLVQFKIPPTPLYEKNVKNEFVWKALQSDALVHFFENEKKHLDLFNQQKEIIQKLGFIKNQQIWLKATQDIFETQLASKAFGSSECQFKISPQQTIKLRLSIDEKQNIKLMTLDFTNTSPAGPYSAASHVVESGLVQKILHFYQIEDYFSQSILDKIKIILPPKSIVSKAHPLGDWNFEIQSICTQLCAYNLQQLNTQSRKNQISFSVSPELKLEVMGPDQSYFLSFEQKNTDLCDLEKLLNSKKIQLLKLQKTEQFVHLKFNLVLEKNKNLKIKSKILPDPTDYLFKINDLPLTDRQAVLKNNDLFEIRWKFC